MVERHEFGEAYSGKSQPKNRAALDSLLEDILVELFEGQTA